MDNAAKKKGRFTFYDEDIPQESQVEKRPQSPVVREPSVDESTHHRVSSKGVDVGLMTNIEEPKPMSALRPLDFEAEISSFKSKSPRGANPPSVHQRSSKAHDGGKHSKLNSAALQHGENAQVPLEVFNSFRDVISEQLSAMMSMHREIMLELIRKDSRRDEQAMLLCRENADLVKAMLALESENGVYRERISRYKE